jgi:hypothetical protein
MKTEYEPRKPAAKPSHRRITRENVGEKNSSSRNPFSVWAARSCAGAASKIYSGVTERLAQQTHKEKNSSRAAQLKNDERKSRCSTTDVRNQIAPEMRE